jgi:DNA-binding IclR family transcriptional regulator
MVEIRGCGRLSAHDESEPNDTRNTRTTVTADNSHRDQAAVPPLSLLGRAISLLDTVAEQGSCTTPELLSLTGLPRPTLYRLLRTLEEEHLVVKDQTGRHQIGLRVLAWAASLQTPAAFLRVLRPVLTDLRRKTGESVQLYVREGDVRVCVASFEPASGLRVTVPTGSILPLNLGSGGKAFLPWAADGKKFGISQEQLDLIRQRGWAESEAEREVGVGSVSSPILDSQDAVKAVIAVSGPLERFGNNPGSRFGRTVLRAAQEATRLLRLEGMIS